MSASNQFDWVDFYKELSGKLLQYKNNGRLENGKEIIKGITFTDNCLWMPQGENKTKQNKIELTFSLYVAVEDLETLLMEICDVLLSESR